MARGMRDIDVRAGYAAKRIRQAFNVETPEELLVWKILERAILDLALEEHKHNAARWIREYSWPCDIAGVDKVWLMERIEHYNLWPQELHSHAYHS